MSPRPGRLAVVGAGVTGLAAALELLRLGGEGGQPVDLTVVEAERRAGGKVLGARFAGREVDLGAESLLVRDGSQERRLSALGLDPLEVRPATTSAAIWDGRRMLRLPAETVLGVPLHPLRGDVVHALGALGALRAAAEPLLPHRGAEPDGPLGRALALRLGKAVVARLVDPLLGGIYAGPAAKLSVGAVAPQLLGGLQARRSLLSELRDQAAQRGPTGPSAHFVSFVGGLSPLVASLTAQLPPGCLRLGTAAGPLEAVDGRLRLPLEGSAPLEPDGLVLAVPAPVAATLLSAVSAPLAELLRQLDYASVATITLAYPEGALSRALVGSGYLVRHRPRVVTACTFLDRKWPALKVPGRVLLRASVGSAGDEWAVSLDDATLVTSVHRELRQQLGLRALPLEALVQRWHGALPQYRAGHLAWRARVREVEAALGQPVSLAGAALDGVGLAACMESGEAAARRVWERCLRRPVPPGQPGTSS